MKKGKVKSKDVLRVFGNEAVKALQIGLSDSKDPKKELTRTVRGISRFMVKFFDFTKDNATLDHLGQYDTNNIGDHLSTPEAAAFGALLGINKYNVNATIVAFANLYFGINKDAVISIKEVAPAVKEEVFIVLLNGDKITDLNFRGITEEQKSVIRETISNNEETLKLNPTTFSVLQMLKSALCHVISSSNHCSIAALQNTTAEAGAAIATDNVGDSLNNKLEVVKDLLTGNSVLTVVVDPAEKINEINVNVNGGNIPTIVIEEGIEESVTDGTSEYATKSLEAQAAYKARKAKKAKKK